jgi:hypothetical protein
MRRAVAQFLLLAVGLGLTAVLHDTKQAGLLGDETIVRSQPTKTVFLGGEMTARERIVFTTSLLAASHPGVVLFDTPRAQPHLAGFLKQYAAEEVIPVGRFANADQLSTRLELKTEANLNFRDGRPEGLWRRLFPTAERVVVCRPEPRTLLLQSALLAATMKAPLFVLGPTESGSEIEPWLKTWQTKQLVVVGDAPISASVNAPGTHLIVNRLAGDADVRAAYYYALPEGDPIRTLVVVNPAFDEWASLAPWLAAQKRAGLVFTDKTGRDVDKVVEAATQEPALHGVDHVILLGGHDAIPTVTRPNPLAGKDADIAMEPLTPEGSAPFTYAVGRMFGADHGVLALQVARQRLLNSSGSHTALVVSNAGGGLPLLETISRHTSQELQYCGFQTETMFGNSVVGANIRQRLPSADLFLWEGHHNTLVKDYGFTEWNEPLKPSLIFLQSCLALTEEKALPLLERGAVGVIGSSTRTYSASGGAFSLSCIDGMLYDDQTFGGGLRQAKNFLVTYQMLKEKRLKKTKLTGANLRSSWAFTLWGDPTLKLPLPERPPENKSAVHWHIGSSIATKTPTLIVDAPEVRFDRVKSGKYEASMQPNMRLAGLIRPGEAEESRLVPFRFVEFNLRDYTRMPILKSELPDDCWALSWDDRRHVGYLLILPRAKDIGAISFSVD